MADKRNGESEVRIPAGWEQRGKGFYCCDTEQEFKTLDALLAYVTYARVFQPELFDSWSDEQFLSQNHRGRKREDAEGVSSPQKERYGKLKRKGQATEGASSSTSPMDSEGGEEESAEYLCPELAGCKEGTWSGKLDIIYERRCKLGGKKGTKAS